MDCMTATGTLTVHINIPDSHIRPQFIRLQDGVDPLLLLLRERSSDASGQTLRIVVKIKI